MRDETMQWLLANAPYSLLEAMAQVRQSYIRREYQMGLILPDEPKPDTFTLDRIDA